MTTIRLLAAAAFTASLALATAGADARPALFGPPAAALPDTAAGRCAAAFIATVNDPTPKTVESFEHAWASKARMAARTIPDRVQGLSELHAEWGRLTVKEVQAGSTDAPLKVTAASENAGPIELEFQFDSGEPGKLQSIIISSGGPGVTSQPLTPAARTQTVEAAADKLREMYVYPEVAEKMSAAMLSNLKSGAYDAIADEAVLARRLTDDCRAVSHDKHLGIGLSPKQEGHEGSHGPGVPSMDDMSRENYAFKKVEILPGNIGYLRFDLFVQSDDAYATASAALGFLAHCDAIIFDLRSNGGGSPEMIRYITSYLFESRTHLNDMVDREGKIVEEYWTLDEIPGHRFRPDLPVFVLTSGRTFSGAEEFSYNLKHLKRATLVGETTGGGAHPVRGERLNDRFGIRVPFMRARNPISQANWEGTGVEPDVKVAAAEALDKTQELARAAVGHAPKP
jgi:hypothetical protein